jgi:phosphatidylglycerol---prolipoprotein diacylglyceryl transferase
MKRLINNNHLEYPMWVHNINPTLLHLGPLEIRWYGLVYVFGFLLGIWWLQKYRSKVGLTKEQVWDFMFYLILGVLVGARLFMIIWQPAYYLSSPFNIFKVWEGGMSFHGGFVGAALASYLYSRKHHINLARLADIVCVPAIFALALGRVANFINGELVGRLWDGSLCVVFPGFDDCRHPSTLYAAGNRFLVFGWLYFLSLKKEFKPGFIFWNFVFFEGLGRFIVDFYREDVLYFSLSLGQWMSLVMVAVAIWVFAKKYKGECRKLFG